MSTHMEMIDTMKTLILFSSAQTRKRNSVFHFSVSLVSLAQRYELNKVWSPGHNRCTCDSEQRAQRRRSKWTACFVTHGQVLGKLVGPGAQTFHVFKFQVWKQSQRLLNAIIMVKLNYLIRISFLAKHELGGLCECCWEVWFLVPQGLSVFLEDDLVICCRNG
jgi:hypothetical protein